MFVFFVIFALQISLAQGAFDDPGIISGIVTDDSNNPIKGLSVLAQLPGNPASSFSVHTDDNGRFQLTVPLGKYLLFTTDEQERFANCTLTVFSCAVPSVDVGLTKPKIEIALKTSRAARLRGTIRNQKTEKPVDASSILLRRGDSYYMGFQQNVGPTFSVLVPANADLTLSVSSIKYRLWTYRAPRTNYATFRVAPSAEINLEIDLVLVDP